MSEVVREKNFEEEFKYYKKRAKEIFDKYRNPNGNEDPLEICVVRDGLRALRKANDLINRLKADVERLETGQLKEAMTFNSNTIDDTVNEALEEFVNKIHSIITEIYNKYVFNGFNDLNSEEIDAVINYSDDVTQEIDNFLKEKVGENKNV